MTINTSSSSTIKTASTSKKFAFTYNHINKTIVGTDNNFLKAGIPGSDLEKELLARMAGQPTYTFEVIATEKKPEKRSYAGLTMDLMEAMKAHPNYELSVMAPKVKKQSYKGLTFELMMDYVEVKGSEVQKAEFEAHVNNDEAYPALKSWFLDNFKVGFTVEKAKREIAECRLNAKKAKVRTVVKAKVVKATPAVVELPSASNF